MGYLTGKIQEPKLDYPSYDKWKAENSTITSWLLHSMQPEISQGYMVLNTSKEIWDAAAQIYSKIGKIELKRQMHETTQGEWSVATYLHLLCALWQELDHYQNFQTACAVDAVKFHKFVEDGRIYEFLASLNFN